MLSSFATGPVFCRMCPTPPRRPSPRDKLSCARRACLSSKVKTRSVVVVVDRGSFLVFSRVTPLESERCCDRACIVGVRVSCALASRPASRDLCVARRAGGRNWAGARCAEAWGVTPTPPSPWTISATGSRSRPSSGRRRAFFQRPFPFRHMFCICPSCLALPCSVVRSRAFRCIPRDKSRDV